MSITTLVPKQDWAGTAGHVLVGTPGKTLEYCKKRWVKCDAVKCLVRTTGGSESGILISDASTLCAAGY